MFFKCKPKKIFMQQGQLLQLKSENADFQLIQTQNTKKYLFDLGHDNQYTPVFAIYGYMLSVNELKDVKSNLERFINGKNVQKQQKYRKRITLIYFSVAMEKKVIQYKTFKREVLQQLSNECIKSIKAVYVLKEKSVSSNLRFFHQIFGYDQKHQQVSQLAKSFSNLEDMVRILGPLFKCQLIKQQVKNYNQQQDYLFIYKPEQVKRAKDQMKLQQNRAMNQCLFKKNSFDKIKFDPKQISLKLNFLVEVLESHPEFCKSQGIFRKSCDSQNVKNLYQELNRNNQKLDKQQISNYYDAYTIACCIKTFLVQLEIIDPELLVKIIEKIKNKSKQQNMFVKNRSPGEKFFGVSFISSDQNTEQDKIPDQIQDDLLLQIGLSMEEVQRKTLYRFLIFLRNSIIPNQHVNLMSPYNLSVVLNPCLFKLSIFHMKDFQEIQKSMQKLLNLFLQMLENPAKLYRTQILTVEQ